MVGKEWHVESGLRGKVRLRWRQRSDDMPALGIVSSTGNVGLGREPRLQSHQPSSMELAEPSPVPFGWDQRRRRGTPSHMFLRSPPSLAARLDRSRLCVPPFPLAFERRRPTLPLPSLILAPSVFSLAIFPRRPPLPQNDGLESRPCTRLESAARNTCRCRLGSWSSSLKNDTRVNYLRMHRSLDSFLDGV